MKKMGIFILVFLWATAVFPAPGDSDLQELHWLKGQWKARMGQNAYYENWKVSNHGTLEGSASMINPQGKTTFTELLRIDKIGTHIVYIAAVNKNHPVLFTLIETPRKHNKPRWVFENKEHDFPQRIVYIQEAQDSLLACVEGIQEGKVEKEEFRLTREKK